MSGYGQCTIGTLNIRSAFDGILCEATAFVEDIVLGEQDDLGYVNAGDFAGVTGIVGVIEQTAQHLQYDSPFMAALNASLADTTGEMVIMIK